MLMKIHMYILSNIIVYNLFHLTMLHIFVVMHCRRQCLCDEICMAVDLICRMFDDYVG